MIQQRALAAWVFTVGFCFTASAYNVAPGEPGQEHHWSPASKQAIGAAFEKSGAKSPIWFTISEGIVSEVFYPTVDQPQIGQLEVLVTDGKSFVSEQRKDMTSTVEFLNEGMTVQITSHDPQGRFDLTEEIVTDSNLPVLRIHGRFEPHISDLKVYGYLKPALGNNGAGDTGVAHSSVLSAIDLSEDLEHHQEIPALAFIADQNWVTATVGYTGASDGLTWLKTHYSLDQPWDFAGPGNIALTGLLKTNDEAPTDFDMAVGFGTKNTGTAWTAATESMKTPFASLRAQYEGGWRSYVSSLLKHPGTKFLKSSSLARKSVKLIKMHEDKRTRGALVAGLVIPDLPGNEVADDTGFYLGSGYHVVWPRDLFHSATGLLAAGDWSTPLDILKHYRETQLPEGSWPQNMWVDGTTCWESLQMDEVSYPILFTSLLADKIKYHPTTDDMNMVKKAARFIYDHGPASPQDRWEEVGGYIPQSIASEIAALKKAAVLLKTYGVAEDAPLSALFNSRSEEWNTQLESWVLVNNGTWGSGYYLRVSPSGTPNQSEVIKIANGRNYDAREIIDSGFLDLVRRGLRAFDDPRILKTLELFESPELEIAAPSPSIPGALEYRQYNHGAYGAEAIGGYWPLIVGERGVYAVAAHDLKRAILQKKLIELGTISTGLIPEQLIDPPVKGQAIHIPQGGATPLAWSHAEYLVLSRSIQDKTVFDR